MPKINNKLYINIYLWQTEHFGNCLIFMNNKPVEILHTVFNELVKNTSY